VRVRPTAVIVAAIAAVLAVVPASASPTQVRETLRGTVDDSARIFLRHADGRSVTHLDPGEYAIIVEDSSVEHNFHLFGPGVNQTTSVENRETATWTVTFADGQTYRFQCDPHLDTMRGSFTVGNVPPPQAPAPIRRLSASVTARAIAVRTSSGSRARTVARGRYRIAVRDSSRRENFHLTGPGINRKTTVAGMQKPTWTVTLRAGRYTYRSDRTRRLRGTFRVR
jgi:plastocyanin